VPASPARLSHAGVAGKQAAALRLASTFAPKSRWALFVRNRIFQLLSIPWVASALRRAA
jgi:hypothetical protein